ncbi:pentatricopeptide repeat-containing protein At2g20710, mitochondrial-like [Prunus dulcis]|nr:pentatricopeptide repeat-containing protein At2g20710, mitochondrial-like [Prunus dulcis]
MTSYAAIGSKHEVYRIWELYKNVVGFYNNGYRCMLSSLLKMDDIYGAEKIVEEWESGNKFFNIQIPNLLINAYCRKGLLEKAKSYVKKLSEGGKECCRTWALLATTYHMNDRMEEAVETLKMAASSASRPGWKFDNSTLAACFEYLKQKGDVEKAHELLILFRERGHFTTDLCDKIRNYIGGCAPPGSGVR